MDTILAMANMSKTKPSNQHSHMGAGLFLYSGWGGRIRTYEMSESESDALPLGDTPLYVNLFYKFSEELKMKN